MKSKRNKLLNRINRNKYNKTYECRKDKHVWINSKFQSNMRTCKCCSKIEFRKK